jgi:hypothetical protein
MRRRGVSWRTGVKWALAAVFIALPAWLEAAPRVKKPRASRGKQANEQSLGADAKKVDLAEAVKDEIVLAQFMTRGPGLAVLRLTNRTPDQPIVVQVPLTMGGVPAPPKGSNEATNFALFGTADPPSLVGVVSPRWTGVGVEKKRGKKAAKPAVSRKKKKKADETDTDDDADKEADGDKKGSADAKGDDKDKDKSKDSTVANVPLPAGVTIELPLISLSLDMKKGQPGIQSPYSMTELEKVSQAPEMEKLLAQVADGTLSDLGVAQILVWRLNGRHSWDEMAETGLIAPQQLNAAKQWVERSEGGGGAGAGGGNPKKGKRADNDD